MRTNAAAAPSRPERRITDPTIYPKRLDLDKEWFVQYWDETGRHKQRVPNLPTLSARKEAAKKVILKIKTQKKETPKNKSYSKVLLLEKLYEELQHRYKLKYIKKRTFQTYKSHIDRLKLFADEKKLTSLSEKDSQRFVEYLVENDLCGRTINSYFTTFNGYANRLLKKKAIKKNPFLGFEPLPELSDPTGYFKESQLKLIDENIDKYSPYFRLVVSFVYSCMTRTCAELPNLKIEDINFDLKLLRFKSTNAKNNKHKWVIIPDYIIDELLAKGFDKYPPQCYIFGTRFLKYGVPSEKPCCSNYLSGHFTRFVRSIGIKKLTLYCMKNGGNIQLHKNGATFWEIKEQNRHYSIQQTQTYMEGYGIKEMKEMRGKFQNAFGK